ncbi:lysophospholipid acyltransferase family protein [Sutcliffiella deserti]|uniref:lysophospholipid acyltransferase family protein n=1 Tax=Sutcliffiella deserti TaxID=2875501 RepID=UPI001CBA6FB3|nr:lysophospholipid acyltransferase family protein [Sutcliffiella deserti]
MIPAKKSKAFEFFFDQFNKRFLSFQFKGIYWATETNIVTLPSTSALFIANHSTWWDPLVIFHLNRHIIKQESYCMMHEKGIKEYPFFRKIGAFSVNRQNPKDIVQSINYAKEKLKDGKALWLFPQGDEHHLETRPLAFLPGAIHIVKNSDIPIVPVGLYYTFGNERKPEIYIKIGKPLVSAELKGSLVKEKNLELESHFTFLLDSLKQEVITKSLDQYKNIL